ncbi:carboxypeptidase-like protein [Flavobacteriaceae bacterium MAR_2009_75]|nr:carboxypeptidase-like protein [Flavobacteriaceae bacterium MAR_2009_75]
MRALFIVLLLQLFGACFSSFAEESEFLRGRVYDSQTGEAIVFATVRIKGRAKGVITNMDGGFRLPHHLIDKGDSIQVTSMGYEKKDLAIQRLSASDINIIRLSASAISLNEAVVRAKRKRKLTANQILYRAIKNIPKNYPNSAYTIKGYYRDYQLDSLGYLNLNEAFLEVFDQGFNEIDSATTKTRIFDYVQNTEFRRDDLAAKPYDYENYQKIVNKAFLPSYGGNEFLILRIHDPIRNYRINSFDFVNVMYDSDIINNHSFKKHLDTYLEDEGIYKIGLEKSYPEYAPDYTALGTIYISKNDYAIHKLEYAVYDDNISNNQIELLDKDVSGKLIFEVVTEYVRGDSNKMKLNYISFQNSFQLSLPPKFIVENIDFHSEKRAIVVKFNNPLGKYSNADKRNNYSFRYKGKRLDIEKVVVADNRSIVFLNMDEQDWIKMKSKRIGNTNERFFKENLLDAKIKNITDIDGNQINQRDSKDFNQFREFFVQETKRTSEVPHDSLLMNIRKPIYMNQPIVKPNDYQNYWMNTPFKELNPAPGKFE